MYYSYDGGITFAQHSTTVYKESHEQDFITIQKSFSFTTPTSCNSTIGREHTTRTPRRVLANDSMG